MKSSQWVVLACSLVSSWLFAQEADLRITKAAEPSLLNLGATVTWTLQVENLGPASINQARIQDTLPGGIELVDLDTRCEVDQQSSSLVECLLPLGTGEMQTLVIRARVDSPPNPPQLVNSATIADALGETSDPFAANNSATASSDYIEGPLPLDLRVSEVIQVQEQAGALPSVSIVVTESIHFSDNANVVANQLPLVIHVVENIVLTDQATALKLNPEIIFKSGFESP